MLEPRAWQLRVGLATAHALLLVVDARGNAKLKPDVHLYFADRYFRLARHHHRRGNTRRENVLLEKARRHLDLGGGDPLPPAAALAMPVPRRPTFVEAIGWWDETPPPNNAA